jgi:hypothetical protein
MPCSGRSERRSMPNWPGLPLERPRSGPQRRLDQTLVVGVIGWRDFSRRIDIAR